MEHQGVGPWTIIKNVPLSCSYLGKPSEPVIDLALGYLGDVQIELIQQINKAPSPYLDYMQREQFGLHHTAYLSHHIERDIELAEANGHKVVCDINMPDGGRYVYTQIPALGKDVYIEFLAASPRMEAMFTQGIEAAKHWQGEPAVSVIDFAN